MMLIEEGSKHLQLDQKDILWTLQPELSADVNTYIRIYISSA